ncbi:hypothetical protein MJK70_00150 [Klebsiella pneumoniae]|nr:hypothetical protein MJK70_00150 [Klebsiella pneumoniae]
MLIPFPFNYVSETFIFLDNPLVFASWRFLTPHPESLFLLASSLYGCYFTPF